jgi:hypothetical protein
MYNLYTRYFKFVHNFQHKTSLWPKINSNRNHAMSQTQSSEYQKSCPRSININFNVNF